MLILRCGLALYASVSMNSRLSHVLVCSAT